MTAQEMIQLKYSGQISAINEYINISIQVIGILIAGIIVWRLVVRYQNKKHKERFRTNYFKSSFSRHWRK